MSIHPLQSFEWGEFRKKTGVNVVRGKNFQLTVHKIPYTPFAIGYLPKGPMPTRRMIEELIEIGKRENCIFLQIEPNVIRDTKISGYKNSSLFPSFHPLFTKYTFILDLTKSEEELFKNMHPKTRYNIKVAQKHGVKVAQDNSHRAFKTYLRLLRETVKRQKFYAHDERYHIRMWEVLREAEIAHLFIATYKNQPLVAWMLFVYDGVLYYPYGGSSNRHKETMASNLMLWEAIRFGKKLGLKTFDLWGSLGPNPDKNNPWYGFHRFKEGYGGELIEFMGSYDLVINPMLYTIYKIVDKIRWSFL